MSSKCPKCGEKIKPTYLKQSCPKCGVNMLYYKLDEQLEQDARQAEKEVAAVNHFIDILKRSAIGSPLNIIRLILFFTPLASMCLPMFYAGHKNVSLITFIMSIINHGFDFGALTADKGYFFAVLSMVLVIVVSIAEIVCSLFSVTKNGALRNKLVFGVNLIVLLVMTILAFENGALIKAGLLVTLVIYIVKLLLHLIIGGADKKSIIIYLFVTVLGCCAIVGSCITRDVPETFDNSIQSGDINVISFNVASAFGTSLEDTDSMTRCARFADCINEKQPDFVGTQEMNSFWLGELDKSLKGYNSYGVKRGGDSEEKNSEMNAVFYKDTYKLVEENTIWLSETPEKESKYTYTDDEGKPAEAGCNRVCSYVVVIDDSNTYLFMNTHLDNSSEQARTFGAGVILDKIDELMTTYPDAVVILTGDFNEDSEGEAYKMLADKLNDCTDESKQCATYQEWGYRQTGDKPIDFIFTTGTKKDYVVINDLSKGYISDHYGIQSTINIK